MNNMPKHIAIIMDGNRRWAKQNNLNYKIGHKTGAETLEKIAKVNSSSSDFMEIVINKIKNNLGTQSYEDYLSDLKEFKMI